MDEKIKAIFVAPGEPAVAKEIDGGLESLQHQVGGIIQCVYPFDDQAAIVCNDEGKLMGMEPNRALRGVNGEIYDIICGPFLVVGLSEDNFASLTDEQQKIYLEQFKNPQQIMMKDGKIEAVSITGKQSFDEFREKIIDEIKDRFACEGKEVIVVPKKVDKSNGSYKGISVSMLDSSVALCVNLESVYKKLDHSTPDELAEYVFDGIKDGFNQVPEAKEPDLIMDYSWVKEHLAADVVSAELAGDYLKNVPSKNIGGDLYAIYRVQVSETASTVVNNNMLEAYGISTEQLHADALSSSEKNYPLNIRPMGEVLSGFFGQPAPDDNIGLYVCTSENRSHGGAGVVAYSEFPEKASEKVGGDFYILPSSIHEVLIIPDTSADREALEDMVRTINRAELRPEDVLSGNVYHYDIADRKLELAADYEVRQQIKAADHVKSQDTPKRKGR